MLIQENISILNHNTFHIDARARYFVEYSNIEELQDFLASELTAKYPLFCIGSGSNLLFTGDYKGILLHSGMTSISITGENGNFVDVYADAGVVWDDFVAYSVAKGLYGAENLSLIPGEVGATAIQNIGAYGIEAKDIIHQVHAIEIATGRKRDFDRVECAYGYRQSIFKNELKDQYIVTGVTYRLRKESEFVLSYGNLSHLLEGRDITLQTVRDTIIEVRESKLPDPKILGNAGSFFMNPFVSREKYESLKQTFPDMPHYFVDEFTVKVPAGWLIEQCGWKGKGIGQAAVHDKQALVLVNKGGATAQDIVDLAKCICEDVKIKFDIIIRPEVIYI